MEEEWSSSVVSCGLLLISSTRLFFFLFTLLKKSRTIYINDIQYFYTIIISNMLQLNKLHQDPLNYVDQIQSAKETSIELFHV